MSIVINSNKNKSRLDWIDPIDRAYGAVGDGVTDDTAALNLAITAAANKVLYLGNNKTFHIDDTVTIPANVGLVIDNGTTVDIASSKYFIISGPVQMPLDTALSDVFTGSGEVLLNNSKSIYLPNLKGNVPETKVIPDIQRRTALSDINACYIYDTSKDTDGGAWRKSCRWTSWYQEAASATRGSRAEFPEVAALIATDDNLYIYDCRDWSLWMRFDNNTSGNDVFRDTGCVTVFALNGLVCCGSSEVFGSLQYANFRKDIAGYLTNVGHYAFKSGLSDRDAASGFLQVSSTSILVNRQVNSVHAAVIDGHTYCIVEDQLVPRIDGSLIRIKDVKVGDYVLTLDETLQKIVPKPVTATFDNGIREVVKVTLKTGRVIKCTPDHKFLTETGWIPVEDIGEGGIVATPRYVSCDSGEDTQKIARLLGYLIGDGSFIYKSVIFTNKNKEIVSDLERCLPMGTKLIHSRDIHYRLVGDGIHNPVLDLLRYTNLKGCNAYSKFVPDMIFESNLKSIAAFLGGLWSTDGHINTRNKRLSYSTVSEELAWGIQHLLLRFGIQSYLNQSKYKNGKIFVISIYGSEGISTFLDWIEVVGKEEDCSKLLEAVKNSKPPTSDIVPNVSKEELKSKLLRIPSAGPLGYKYENQELFKEISSMRGEYKGGVTRHKLQRVSDHLPEYKTSAYSDIYWDKIVSIEFMGEKKVYDVTVEDNHNLIVQDIFVHNCAVGTDGGVSIIRFLDDGRVDTSYGTSGVVDGTWSSEQIQVVKFDDAGNLYMAGDTAAWRVFTLHQMPTSDFSLLDANGVYAPLLYPSTFSHPYFIGTLSNSDIATNADKFYVAANGGLSAMQELPGDESNGSVQYTTTTYITPPMKGDVRGAYVPAFTDSSYTQDSEGAIDDRSASGMDLTAKGADVDVVNFGNGAAKAFSFNGTTNYLQQETQDTEQNELAYWIDNVSDHQLAVTAIADGATEDTVTVDDYGDDVFADGDRVVVSDETGYKVEGVVDGTPSSTSIDVDDGAGGDPGTTEEVGVCATLDGASQYFYKASPTGIDIAADNGSGAGDYSMSCWIKRDSNPTGIEVAVVKKSAVGYGVYLGVSSDGKARAVIGEATSGNFLLANGSSSICDGKWHHLALTYEDAASKTVILYVDGYEAGSSDTPSGTKTSGSGVLYIGTLTASNNLLTGSVRDVAVYPGTCLTTANVLSLATNPLTEVGSPASWWKLTDAASQTSPQDSASAGNNNHLTPVGGTTTNYGTHSRTQSATISKNLVADGSMENGGIGGWLTTGTVTSLKKDTDSVKKGVHSLEAVIPGGAAEWQGMRQNATTINGNDYVLRGWTQVANGTARLEAYGSAPVGFIDVDDTSLAFAEMCFEADAASTSIWFRDYQNSNTLHLDDLQLLPNLVADGGMEDTLTNNWTQEGSATMVADTSEHSGAQEMKITAGAATVGASQAITLVSGKWYEVSGWARATAGDTARITVDKGDTTTKDIGNVTSTSYTRVSEVFLSTGTSGVLYLRGVANGDIVWFDDVSIIHRPDLDVGPTHFVDSGYLGDTAQDFGEWETTSGDADYMLVVTNEDDTVGWGYMDVATTQTNTDDMIPVYTDKALTTPGFNGTMGGPESYVIRDTKAQITGALTVAAWVKNPNVSDYILAKYSSVSPNQRSFGVLFDGSGYGKVIVSETGSSDIVSTGAVDLSDDNWHQIVGVLIPSTSITLYVDGLQVAQNTSSIPASIYDSYVPMLVGAGMAGGTVSQYWNGEIAFPLILAESLTAAEVKELYDVGKAILEMPATGQGLQGASNQVNAISFDEESEILWAGTEDGATALQTVNGWVAGAIDIDDNGEHWDYQDGRVDDSGNALISNSNADVNAISVNNGSVIIGTESEIIFSTLGGKTSYEEALNKYQKEYQDPLKERYIIGEWFISGNLATGDGQGGKISIKGSWKPTKLVCVVTTTGDTGGDTSIDLEADGATVLYSTIDIAYNDSDSVGYTTEFDVTSYPFGLTDGTLLSINIDSIPTGTTSTDLKVILYGDSVEDK